MAPAPALHAPALLRKPFDHYARYRVAAEVAQAVGARRLLDVGGGPGSLQGFLPNAEVVACDASFPSFWHEAAPSLVLADGAALPFPDRCFDLVVSLDTLEHVVPEHRAQLLAELVRVSGGWVLVACPCATPGVADADAALLSYVRQKFGEEFETVGVLTEHLSYGHPDPDETEQALVRAGAEVARFPSGRLDRWLPMMLLFYELMALGVDDPVERVQAWYNGLYYRDDLRAPSYRTGFLCCRANVQGPTPKQLVAQLLPPDDEQTVADASHLQALRIGLDNELADALERERARVAELEQAVAAAGEECAAQRARAHAAEQQVAALEAFRQQILAHPLLRLRRAAKRLVPRSRR